jgi:hypothetical protein
LLFCGGKGGKIRICGVKKEQFQKTTYSRNSEDKRTFCKADVSDVLKPDVLKTEVFWVVPNELCRLKGTQKRYQGTLSTVRQCKFSKKCYSPCADSKERGKKPDIVQDGVLRLCLHLHPCFPHLLESEAHSRIVNGIS